MVEATEAEVKKALRRIKRLNLWEKAQQIIKKFGKEKHTEYDDKTSYAGSLNVAISGNILNITLSSYGQFHQNCHLEVFWNNELVVKVDETMDLSVEDKFRVVASTGQHSYVLRKFSDGEWLKYFSVVSIGKARAAETRKMASDKKRQRESDEQAAKQRYLSEVARDINLC